MYSSDRANRQADNSYNQQQQRDQIKPGLSIDTNFSRHIAPPPLQVFSDASVSYTPRARSGDDTNRDLMLQEQQLANGLRTGSSTQPKSNTKRQPPQLDLSNLPSFHHILPTAVDTPESQHGGRYAGLDAARSNGNRGFSPGTLNTPAIIITPADSTFGLPASPEQHSQRNRAPSSVYSRYTNYMPKSARFSKTSTPPLPFIPSKVVRRPSSGHSDRREQVTSVCTEFEEDAPSTNLPRTLSVRRSVGCTPSTGRRSNGWWNLLTSPTSAHSNLFSWRSPRADDETPILRDNQWDDSDEELRSAPVMTRGVNMSREPRRSMTAPSVLSSNEDSIDIHWIPSHGEAAAFYDPGRHFPSLIISPSQMKSTFEDETPVTSREPSNQREEQDSKKAAVIAMPMMPHDPFGDEHDIDPEPSRGMFTSPSPEELKTPMPPMPDHSPTTNASQFSPLSPSPIVGRAQIAQIIGQANGDQKEIDLSAPRAASSPLQGLGAATMASRSQEDSWKQLETAQRPSNHTRTSSHGLGISGSDVELFPASRVLNEKHLDDDLADKPVPWYRRVLLLVMGACAAVLLVIMIVLLVIYLPQKRSDIPVQAQWVNLTGYPPLPTGVTTISQPKAVRKADGCVNPASLWSCGTSAAQRSNSSELPNFRFVIRFKNDSSLNSSLLQSGRQKRSGGAVLPTSIAMFTRDTWSDSLFETKPAPPSDQLFIGNTTDNNTTPYDGEATPFSMSLVDAKALLTKRQSTAFPYPTGDNSTSTNTSSTGPQSIPNPSINTDGTPSAEILYPLVEAQPLRLYKRGQQDEHYGFYTYYDRTVYVANSSSGSIISNTALSNASAVCTWSQSRFLVQIWTRGFVSSGSSNGRGSDTTAGNSTANDMSFPGSFPYATTITIDRHGGDASRKGVYCYGVGANQHVAQNVKSWIAEDRAYGGSLINPATVPTGITRRESSGGVDGGSGGCACAWQNW